MQELPWHAAFILPDHCKWLHRDLSAIPLATTYLEAQYK